MRDPHVHVEKTIVPGFGHAAMRDYLLKITGYAGDMPKTVGTGCGRRRPFAMTSLVPEHVTCLACREYAVILYRNAAVNTEALLQMAETDPTVLGKHPPEYFAQSVEDDLGMAARYATT